jgi:acetyl-CoA decarbonylase/synthase complex subunit gamma
MRFQFERVGLNLRPELVAVKDANGDAAAFAAVAKQIAETSEFNLILMTEDADVMKAGVEACGFKRPLIYAATESQRRCHGRLAKDKRSAPGRQGRFHGGLVPLDGQTDRHGTQGSGSGSRFPGSPTVQRRQVAIRRAP